MIAPPPSSSPSAGGKPAWLRIRPPSGENWARIRSLRSDLGLRTVCEDARCPNLAECWGSGTATFMLLGRLCTRACRFCAVASGNPRGEVDGDEPRRTAEAVAAMGLAYVVLTTVDRDDLPDGGAKHIARTIEAVRGASPGILIETLTGDFAGSADSLRTLVGAAPDVFAHNIETVRRLQRVVRDARAGYEQSLDVLRRAAALRPGLVTKSSLMLGLSETDEEVEEALMDLRTAGVSVVTLGQYLQPTPRHLPVHTFIEPATFEAWRRRALDMGFLWCASGPLVRSSYRAAEAFLNHHLRQERR